MPTIASGILKTTSFKKQSGLGVTASGAGGQKLRRTSAIFKADRDTFESDEIASHHQSTGVAYGLSKSDGKVDGILSSGTYAAFFGSLLEKDFVAVSPGAAAAATTVAASGANYTITRGAGSWLTDGIKVGRVVRITGAGIAAANLNKNLLVVAVTALVCTVFVLNGSTMTAEGPIATYVLTQTGKSSFVPETGHTKDYYTIEEWYSDLTRSELFGDHRIASIAVNMPATGNATLSVDTVGLSRALAGAQVLTSPTAETTTGIMSAANGRCYIGDVNQVVATGINFTIANSAANSGAVIGQNNGNDVTTGRIRVSGTFTGQFDSATLQNFFNAETATSIYAVLTADETATSDFITFMMSKIKITSDVPDDGEKAIMRSYSFIAEMNAAGGTALQNSKTIIEIQDSAA